VRTNRSRGGGSATGRARLPAEDGLWRDRDDRLSPFELLNSKHSIFSPSILLVGVVTLMISAASATNAQYAW
jgi:hypothetical protein